MSKPKRIILVRHGESQGNVDKHIYENIPDYALELTEKGWAQAEAAGQNIFENILIGNVGIYCSSFVRTYQTLDGILKAIPREKVCFEKEDVRLRELEWGNLYPKRRNDAIIPERNKFGWFYYRFPNGESGSDVWERISDFLNTLHRDFEKEDFPETVIIPTHGLTMRIFLGRWFHWNALKIQSLRNPKNCEYAVLDLQADNRFKVQYDLSTYEFGIWRDYPNFNGVKYLLNR